MAYILDGKELTIGKSFTHNDILYPKNWLTVSTQAEKDALGVTWQEDEEAPLDTAYYFNGDVNTPKTLTTHDVTWTQEEADNNMLPSGKSVGDVKYVKQWDEATQTEVDTDVVLQNIGLKDVKTAEVKETAGRLLSETDWYVTRKSEKDIAIPTDVATRRDEIRTECDRLETAIAGASTVEALIEVMNSQDWGE